jgi:hypothetical protein
VAGIEGSKEFAGLVSVSGSSWPKYGTATDRQRVGGGEPVNQDLCVILPSGIECEE